MTQANNVVQLNAPSNDDEFTYSSVTCIKSNKVTKVTESWADFKDRFKQPIIGDKGSAGGFVLAQFNDDIRKGANLKSRCGAALDLDHIDVSADDALAIIDEAYKGLACLVYTTSSHTPDKPKMRVVAFSDSPYTPDKHEPISRKLMERLRGNMSWVDNTTHEPSRVMFYPTVKVGQRDNCINLEVTKVSILILIQSWLSTMIWGLIPMLGKTLIIGRALVMKTRR